MRGAEIRFLPGGWQTHGPGGKYPAPGTPAEHPADLRAAPSAHPASPGQCGCPHLPPQQDSGWGLSSDVSPQPCSLRALCTPRQPTQFLPLPTLCPPTRMPFLSDLANPCIAFRTCLSITSSRKPSLVWALSRQFLPSLLPQWLEHTSCCICGGHTIPPKACRVPGFFLDQFHISGPDASTPSGSACRLNGGALTGEPQARLASHMCPSVSDGSQVFRCCPPPELP